MEITIVMDDLESIRAGEEKLRKIEGDSKRHGPPEGMKDHAWVIDRGYLLSALRLYARKIYYGLWERKENIGLEDDDFKGMEVILTHRAEKVKKYIPLQAFVRVVAVLKLKAEDKSTPLELEKAMVYVFTKREDLDPEDYIFLTAYLSEYANAALNKRQGDYATIALRGQISVIESKYGKRWQKGDQPLAYRLLTNLASNAMNFAQTNTWRGLPMDLVPNIGTGGTVFEWIEALLQAYESRLEDKYQKPALAYVRARSAFFQKDYIKMAEQLMLIPKMPADFFGPHLSRLRLIAYYELLYCQGMSTLSRARTLVPDVKATIKNMRSQLNDLDKRQERYTFQLVHFSTFINGYSALLTTKEKSEKMPDNSKKRFNYLLAERPKIEAIIKGYDHFSGKWITRQIKNLN